MINYRLEEEGLGVGQRVSLGRLVTCLGACGHIYTELGLHYYWSCALLAAAANLVE